MIRIPVEQVLMLHRKMISATGGDIGIRDISLLDSALLEYQTDPLFVRNINCDLGDFEFLELSIT
jgi:hypothetical protein